jgi:hypothetical protein
MDEQKAVVPVGVVRERVIQALTEAFANDQITVAELEDRLEKVYRAGSAAEAEALVVGLRPVAGASASVHPVAAHDVDAVNVTRAERFLTVFSSQSRRGVWSVPRKLDVVALFSDTTIDLSHAMLPKDIVDLEVKVIFANMRIVVPAGLRVVNRVGAFASNVESEPALDLAPMKPGAPVIRITGNVVFGNVEIVAGQRFTGE